MSGYDYRRPSIFSSEECKEVVGQRATLVLQGKIVESYTEDGAPFVSFEPDERFGFDHQFGLQLDLLDVIE